MNEHAAPIFSYRDLVVWQKAMNLVEASYKLSRKIPKTEIYGLASQIRRASVSIPANIAEGHGRRNLGEYLQHLSIANGSLKELETDFLIGRRLGFLQEKEVAIALTDCEEIGRMLAVLMQRLREKKSASAINRL